MYIRRLIVVRASPRVPLYFGFFKKKLDPTVLQTKSQKFWEPNHPVFCVLHKWRRPPAPNPPKPGCFGALRRCPSIHIAHVLSFASSQARPPPVWFPSPPAPRLALLLVRCELVRQPPIRSADGLICIAASAPDSCCWCLMMFGWWYCAADCNTACIHLALLPRWWIPSTTTRSA